MAGFKPDGPKVESLLVGFYEDKKLKFAGKVRAGLTPHNRRALASRLTRLVISKCPLTELNIVKSSQWSGGLTEEDLKIVKWTQPRVVIQVAFVEWTRDGLLRHPKFLGLSEDKPAKQVTPGAALDRLNRAGIYRRFFLRSKLDRIRHIVSLLICL